MPGRGWPWDNKYIYPSCVNKKDQKKIEKIVSKQLNSVINNQLTPQMLLRKVAISAFRLGYVKGKKRVP